VAARGAPDHGLQKGLGWFGSLIMLAVGATYSLYQRMVVGDALPSCTAEQNECLQGCRNEAALCENLER